MNGSIQIKRDKYYAVVRFSDKKQKWISLELSVSGNNKRKAQQKFRELMAELEKEYDSAYSQMLFTDWLNKWMKQKKNEVRANTYECYLLFLEKHILPHFEPKMVLDHLNCYISEVCSIVNVKRSRRLRLRK